jgi:hypothetical protein
MRGSGLSALAASEITPAAVRLYARSVEIEIEVEEMIADGDHLTTKELLAWLDRLLHDDDFDLEAEERKTKTAILAKHPEYQYVKTELGRQLGLGPNDINPLDIDFDQEWESADGPGIDAWKRAIHLRHRLSVAHLVRLCWWRRPAQLRLVSEAETCLIPLKLR